MIAEKLIFILDELESGSCNTPMFCELSRFELGVIL